MAITPNCPSCGAAANGFVFTRGGVPVDTSQGFVELGAFQCSDLAACSISQIGNIPNTPTTAGTYKLNFDQATETFSWVADTASAPVVSPIVTQLTGSFLLDPNEVNSFGQFGLGDETATVDVGNIGTPTFPQQSSGFSFPMDVTIDGLSVDYRQDAATVVDPWGFVIATGAPDLAGNPIALTYLLDDLNGVGAPAASRLEADTNVRRFGWTPDTAVTLAAGDVLFFGVAADPATNQGNNDRIDIVRGWVQVTPV